MNLREYLRAEWSQYIRPLIIKDKCEFCGSGGRSTFTPYR